MRVEEGLVGMGAPKTLGKSISMEMRRRNREGVIIMLVID